MVLYDVGRGAGDVIREGLQNAAGIVGSNLDSAMSKISPVIIFCSAALGLSIAMASGTSFCDGLMRSLTVMAMSVFLHQRLIPHNIAINPKEEIRRSRIDAEGPNLEGSSDSDVHGQVDLDSNPSAVPGETNMQV